MSFFENDGVAVCIKCGCDDNHACMGKLGPCHWLRVDRERAVGICSECNHPELIAAWDRQYGEEA